MVSHFRNDLEALLNRKYEKGQSMADPYELVKEFCIEDPTSACENVKIPSVERKKEQLRKANEKLENEKSSEKEEL